MEKLPLIVLQYENMMKELESEDCKNLIVTDILLKYVKEILTHNKDLLKYTLEHIGTSMFDKVYESCIVKKEHQFDNILCSYYNFSQSWLFYRYH